ncbi:MalY/PatB family protein [Paenibacillus sp. NEAU-GSW1]|uniref:MalY/PatB family protein n=1 Tax=Paenibacillus sp. NEAU-GSW1 TaxID=2682486 RepID=UPI0012E0EF5B|nr:MalY/PatB family protein [Paenibacillus sp. NEAU-GSW1]MUT66241.1 putative C-S lyase [Paenibacillus sp. NEAU-GSW1]
MNNNFDQLIDRRNTRSYKWDDMERIFGADDLLPLWVADMDFSVPPAIKEALVKRAELGVYGYTTHSNDYYEAIAGWFNRRHGWQVDPSWISDSPTVVTSLSVCVEQFSAPGDRVVIQTPVYPPFYEVIEGNGRIVAKNPLVQRNNRFEMDLAHLEQLFAEGAKLFILCSPHNPGGRVWTRAELEAVGALCIKYGVAVVSDEIHCDLTFPGHEHTPFSSLSPEIAELTIICTAATKTFNLPGVQTSFLITSNKQWKRRIDTRLKVLGLNYPHHFIEAAIIAAYNEGEQWLDEMLAYVKGNLDFALQYLAQHLPEVKPLLPDGTYLLWVDCRGLGIAQSSLKKWMVEEAKVAFSLGSTFGTEGEGWLRINLAAPRSIVAQALEQFCNAGKLALK